MYRREFNSFLLKAGMTGFFTRRHNSPRDAWEQSSVRDLYSSAIVIDSLCAPLGDIESAPSPEAVAAIRQSGITAINFSISVPDFDETLRNLASVQRQTEDSPDTFLIVRRRSDIDRAKRDGKLGIMLGFQFPTVLEQDVERLSTFRNFGVRIMQLTYNNRSVFGNGCLDTTDAGLTNAGLDAVKQMNSLGIAVDLSHSGYRTTSDGIAHSSKPVLVSHSGCAAVYPHPRNLPDHTLKSLADRGGYIGVYLMPYLVPSPTIPTREHVLEHLLHAINACGADHVGIGSDGGIQRVSLTPEQKANFEHTLAVRKQAGMSAPGEDRFPYVPDLNGPDHMLTIAEELARRGQPSSVIEKVLGGNFYRVIGEIWGTN